MDTLAKIRQDIVEYCAGIGYDASNLDSEDFSAVECAIESGYLEYERGQAPEGYTETELVCSYVGSCFENNFNR